MATNVHTDQNSQLPAVVKVDTNIPTSDPSVAGQVFIDENGKLTVSAG